MLPQKIATPDSATCERCSDGNQTRRSPTTNALLYTSTFRAEREVRSCCMAKSTGVSATIEVHAIIEITLKWQAALVMNLHRRRLEPGESGHIKCGSNVPPTAAGDVSIADHGIVRE